jgi:recombinational DNA repair ATPase RecF
MFQSARPNSQIYIFHKGDTPRIEIGYVVNQPVPRPKYQLPAAFGQPQETVVDLVVKTNDQTYNYNNLPAQQDVADSLSNGESIIISDSREGLNSEILNLKQKSLDIANSKDYHLSLVEKYDKILVDLNPELAEKQEQKQEIDVLKKQMTEMSKSIAALMESNKALIEKLTTKGEQNENVGN